MAESSLAATARDQGAGALDFFNENLAAFREHAPLVHARLAQVKTPHSRLLIDDDGKLDIALGDQRFYGADAVEFAQLQIDEYFAAPIRRYIDGIGFTNTAGVEVRYKDALAAAAGCEPDDLPRHRAGDSSHFTVVFGLGLGLHLDPLLAFTGCTEMIVVEPNFDNVYHSLFVIDWRALFEKAAQAGCTIHLALEKDQVSITSRLRISIRSGNPALIDGVYVYQHYGSSLLTEAKIAFHRDLSMHILGLGYFEDELTMMANATANLTKKNIRVLTSQQLPRPEPIFICGSGPSIDDDMEVIAAQRDRAIIVSIGSSLRTMLARGIRPDIHVETENHPANAAAVERAAREFGLAGITLLGATTVQPAVTELFDDVILYFREGQTPAEVFCSGIEKMGSAGPSVANAALVTLTYMGFRDVYLFGVDMGSRQSDKYHSSDTYIGLGESEEWASSVRLPAPANFGGKAGVETLLSWSRSGLEDVLKTNRVIRCWNCSDGVRIAGTIPMLPRVLDLQNSPLDHADVMADIRSRMPIFPLELTARFWREAELTTESREIFAQIDTLLASVSELDDPGLTWVYDLYDLIDDIKAISPAIGLFLFGSSCLFLGSFWWFDGRIEDTKIRCRLRRTGVEELRKFYAAMEQRLAVLIADIESCIAGQTDTVSAELNI